MPIGTIQQSDNLNIKYSTYQQHCSGSKCSLWGMKMTTLPKLVEFSFIPYMSASVIECRITTQLALIVWTQYLEILLQNASPGIHFSLTSTPFWQI